jgi:selenide,water dikinase
MSQVNTVGAELSERGLVRAATDITGFGLLGHLASMCRASGVSAEIEARNVPVMSDEVFELIARDCVPGGTRQNLQTADAVAVWGKTPLKLRLLLTDAQTSGGLLLAVPPRKVDAVLDILKKRRALGFEVIGRMMPPRRRLIAIR